MASAVDSRLAYARLSAVATASRLPTATRDSNNSYTTSSARLLEKMDKLVPWERLERRIEPSAGEAFRGAAVDGGAPDETTILNFRHLLEKHGLGELSAAHGDDR